MKKERPIGVAIFSWVFIVYPIFYLILNPEVIATFQELFQIFQRVPVEKGFIFGLPFSSAITGFLEALLILIVGIGLLKVKPWAYYLAIIIPIGGLVNIGWSVWFSGPQIFTPLQIVVSISIYMIIILYFFQKKTKEVFQVHTNGFKKLKVIPKIFIILLIASISLMVLSIFLWVGHVHINLRDKLPLINLQPEKTEYKITDEESIWEKCQDINLADISMYLPKELKIYRLTHSDEWGWDLTFLYEEEGKVEATVLLNSKGSQPYYGPLSKALRFDSVYDFERKFNYPTYSPIYLIMKIFESLGGLNSIEDVTTPNWKGFVKINKQKKSNRVVFQCSVHSLDKKRSAGLILMLDKNYMTTTQARNIIASFKFEKAIAEADTYFEEGKKALSKHEYRKASLCFINAYAQDDGNPKYPYYLALSLYEDDNKAGRKMRLTSSKDFLRKALKLKPSHQKAERLLLSIKEEINKIDD